MADNVPVTPGSGATIATDDVGGVHYQVMKLAIGADGAASLVSSGSPLPVSAPAALRTTHHLGAALMVDALMNGLTALTPKFAKVTIAASTTDGAVIAAVASKVLLVISFRLIAAATATTATFNSKPGGAGTAISEVFTLGANGSVRGEFSPVGHFKTVSGEGLSLTTGTGSNVNVGVVYVEV